MLFRPILGQRKTSLVIFLFRWRTSSVVFLSTILFLMAYIRQLEMILAKKTTELVFFFHKKTTKLVFLWHNMGQKILKVLIWEQLFKNISQICIIYIKFHKITSQKKWALADNELKIKNWEKFSLKCWYCVKLQ